jgi:hypothetical protein
MRKLGDSRWMKASARRANAQASSSFRAEISTTVSTTRSTSAVCRYRGKPIDSDFTRFVQAVRDQVVGLLRRRFRPA